MLDRCHVDPRHARREKIILALARGPVFTAIDQLAGVLCDLAGGHAARDKFFQVAAHREAGVVVVMVLVHHRVRRIELVNLDHLAFEYPVHEIVNAADAGQQNEQEKVERRDVAFFAERPEVRQCQRHADVQGGIVICAEGIESVAAEFELLHSVILTAPIFCQAVEYPASTRHTQLVFVQERRVVQMVITRDSVL